MYYVCRWRDFGPFSKSIVTLPDATVLDWFRRGWGEDPEKWLADQDIDAYGLESIFEAVHEHDLPKPATVDELRALLYEHLYVEGDDVTVNVRLDEHTLRVRTDDDEVDLAYYLLDDVAVAASPDRLAYLLNDAWPLPFSAGDGDAFVPDVPVRTVRIAPPAAHCVWSVRIGWDPTPEGSNLDVAGAVAFPGVSLPNLGATLRDLDDARAEALPDEARLLRALVAPGENDPGPALHRYSRLDGYDPSAELVPPVLLPRPEQAALFDLRPDPEPPTRSLVRVDPHIAQVARYIDDFFGFDQWFLFDDRWAAAHPEAALSLLRTAAHWDPFGP
ncbi:hypothetical protein Val02_08180 [Virgisporangium aliadipatigenens]|uniref:Uncharacterized protein n=1 Tax=Virgisporangium aliadipatigenens TaxID=741659 RepID=A0A8J4DNX5_9ACTN|nr:hypothetical protein [Virgisporangium aliadipatigenens]GIJ43932.1 hypothetical protein Val02_08180 [Virgisporangium aliadipatigenens]